MDMDELPFNLIRLRKKDNCGSVLDLDFSFLTSSADGPNGTEGKRLSTRCTTPFIVATVPDCPSNGGLSCVDSKYYRPSMQAGSNMEQTNEVVQQP